jgi:hypothetical protein
MVFATCLHGLAGFCLCRLDAGNLGCGVDGGLNGD